MDGLSRKVLPSSPYSIQLRCKMLKRKSVLHGCAVENSGRSALHSSCHNHLAPCRRASCGATCLYCLFLALFTINFLRDLSSSPESHGAAPQLASRWLPFESWPSSLKRLAFSPKLETAVFFVIVVIFLSFRFGGNVQTKKKEIPLIELNSATLNFINAAI